MSASCRVTSGASMPASVSTRRSYMLIASSIFAGSALAFHWPTIGCPVPLGSGSSSSSVAGSVTTSRRPASTLPSPSTDSAPSTRAPMTYR